MKGLRLPACTLALAAAICTGCGTPGPASGTAASPAPPELDLSIQGRVVTVNAPLRYVVMDFLVRQLPATDQRLDVYRDGQRVGIIKVTGPAMGSAVAGDIVAGDARVGDDVRER